MRRLLIIPRWAGRPSSDWYDWIQGELGGLEVAVAAMPDPDAPTLEAWPRAIEALVPEAHEQLVLVGHSVGCQAILRYLEGLEPGLAVHSVLCIAGWWEVDEPWDSIRPWIETPMDHGKVRAGAGYVSVLLSDNDPFTADFQANQALWEGRLGAEVRVVQGGEHFNHSEEPEVLQALRWHLARGQP